MKDVIQRKAVGSARSWDSSFVIAMGYRLDG
jgi:hypothetical protein